MPYAGCHDGSDELCFQMGRVVLEILWFLLMSLIGGLGGLVVFVYYLRKGQFEDPEDPKYQLLREDEEI